MDLGLSGRVSVVVGASQGIGRAVALGLAAERSNLVLLARNPDGLAAVAAEVSAAHPGVEVQTISTDVTDTAAVDAAAEAAGRRFGTLHVVVYSAGNRMRPGRQITWTDAEWLKDVDAKLFGMLRVVRAFEPRLASDGTGRIINVSGVAGHIIWDTAMTHGINNSAFNHVTKYLATDLASRGIMVNAVTPGLIATEWRHDWAAASGARLGIGKDAFVDKVCREKGILLGRWAETSEVADAIVFLASSRAAYITGTTLIIDGGLCVNPRVA